METLVLAVMLATRGADAQVAEAIVVEAVGAGVEPALALAVAHVETHVRGRNPLGVRGCRRACIRAGVKILARCIARTSTERAALSRYNGHARPRYAALVAWQRRAIERRAIAIERGMYHDERID